MLDRHGIALLRHDRGDLHESIGHVELADLEGGPDLQILDQAAEMQEDELDRAIGRGQVVDRGDAAIGVLQRGRKAEQMRDAGAVQREARGGDCSGAHRREVEQRARLHQSLMVAQHHFDGSREVMAEGGRLGRLAMGIGDDQRRLLALGQVEGRGDQGAQQAGHMVEPRLEGELEQRVIDIVARAAGMEAPGIVGRQALLQLGLDQEEIIFDRAVIAQLGRVDLGIDSVERAGDAAGGGARQDAGLGEHDEMGAVDGAEALDVMRLRPVEERAQHGFLVDGIGKDGGVARAGIGFRHGNQPLRPARTTPRTI